MEKKHLNINIRSPASTANLGAGYDCIAIAIDLWNSYEMRIIIDKFNDGQKEFDIRFLKNRYYDVDPRMRTQDGNLFVRAFNHTRKFIFHRASVTPVKHNIIVLQNNHIPPIRGLGSSSSASVAGVVAGLTYMQELFPNIDLDRLNIKVTDKMILELSREVDSCPDNICASLIGGLTTVFLGPADTNGIKPIYHFKDKLDDSNLKLIFLIPNKIISTQDARNLISKQRFDLDDCVYNLTRAVCIPKIFTEHKYEMLSEALCDRLHQRERAKLYGDKIKINIEAIFDELVHKGDAYAACISGAGSSLLAFASNNDAEHVANDFRNIFEKHARETGWEVEEIRIHNPINTGIEKEVFYTY